MSILALYSKCQGKCSKHVNERNTAIVSENKKMVTSSQLWIIWCKSFKKDENKNLVCLYFKPFDKRSIEKAHVFLGLSLQVAVEY